MGYNKSVYFWCMALGTRPLLYQWETRGSDEHPWMVIKDSSGQNPLKLNAVQSSSQVRCKVSNDVGTVVSNPATVTVFSKHCVYSHIHLFVFKQVSPFIHKARKY